MGRVLALLGLLLICLPGDLQAAPRQILFGPPASSVDFRAYGLGLLAIDANFTRFHGRLTYDPDDRTVCQVQVAIEAASLVTGDAALRDTMVGADFMDAAKFPSLEYAGSCQRQGVGGTLDMHGVTKPFDLVLSWEPGAVVAEGRLVRAEWGMTAMPVLAGRTVRIRVAIALPGEVRAPP